MLRLAHRILSQKALLHGAVGECLGREVGQAHEYAKREAGMIGHSEVICVDNVAQYYAEQDRDEWAFSSFPNIAPPFPMMFFEWNEPKEWFIKGEWVRQQQNAQVGVSVFAGNVTEETRNDPISWFRLINQRAITNHPMDREALKRIRDVCEESSKVLFCSNWVSSSEKPVSGSPLWMGMRTSLFSDKQGRFVEIFHSGPSARWFQKNGNFLHCDSPLHIVCLAISFMHCKNVKRVDRTEEEGPPEKWLRNQKQPTIRYHVLEIDPMKEVLRTEGGSETNGLKKALHICRGHFATYTDEKPLFGRVTGTFWKPAHVRGSASQGIVDKDYSVKAPK